MELKHALFNEKQLALRIAEAAPGLIVVYNINTGAYLYVNQAIKKILGYTPQDFLNGGIGFALSLVHPDDIPEIQARNNAVLQIADSLPFGSEDQDSIVNCEYRMRHRDGTWRWLHTDGSVFARSSDGTVECVLNISVDITVRRESEDALKKLASDLETRVYQGMQVLREQTLHDGLTSLPNRKYLEERLETTLATAAKKQRKVAVMFLDLDRFKHINDSLGHMMGDMVLQEVASRLSSSVRKQDMVARLGGDEFIVLMPHFKAVKDVLKIAEKLLNAIRQPVHIGQHILHPSTSVGISLYPADSHNAQALLRDADAALLRAKEAGRNCYRLYKQAMNRQAVRRFELENNLQSSINLNQFALDYQPIVNVKTKKVIGAEALVRWHHPSFGLLQPDEFIPLAEESGSIFALGEWVLREACRQIKAWRQLGLPSFRVSVNLSARQFSDTRVISTIRKILKETGVAGRMLQLEITESIAMENMDRAISKLRELKAMGLRLAIDDFGIGYSSLNYLKRFPIHTLKIDKSFIQYGSKHRQGVAIVRTIVSMADTLGLSVVAEGVESEHQKRFLRSVHCQNMQGHAICQPAPAAEFAAWIQNQ